MKFIKNFLSIFVNVLEFNKTQVCRKTQVAQSLSLFKILFFYITLYKNITNLTLTCNTPQFIFYKT